ncbi:MAG: hypothetical protein GY742_20875 [Hyphomicrobiales bacterium]|nr:hypothetical protein [Hyphomicrobiales bacterium]
MPAALKMLNHLSGVSHKPLLQGAPLTAVNGKADDLSGVLDGIREHGTE